MASFKNRYADIYAKVAQHRVRVRTLLREQRFRMQQEKTVELVRRLRRNRVRLVRGQIEVGMREARITLRTLRAIAFDERASLEGGRHR